MRIEPLMIIHTTFKEPLPIGRGPFGARFVTDISSGSFEGARLRGSILPSGGVSILFDPEGNGHGDGRLVLETNDGAYIYAQYQAVFATNDRIQEMLAKREETEYGDCYFVAQFRLETGSKGYQWLNLVMAVAEGRLLRRGVEYRVYEVMNDQQESQKNKSK